MNKAEIKNELFAFLSAPLAKESYKPEKGNDRFIRKTPFGLTAISYHIVQYSDYLEIQFFAHIRFDAIEEKWHTVSLTNPKFQKISTTIMINVKLLEGIDKAIIRIQDKASCEVVLKAFIEEVYPKMKEQVFDKYTTLEAAEHFFNGEKGESNSLINNDEKRWIKGVIAAKIIGKDTNDLISTYRTQMAGMADTIKQKFEQAIAV